jgi:hypothetical protein
MKRLSFAVLPVALLCVAAKGSCWDDTGTTASPILPDSGGFTGPDAACPNAPVVCNEPNIPVGCHVGEPTCTNGVPECPQVICPDAGAADVDADATGGDGSVMGDGSGGDAAAMGDGGGGDGAIPGDAGAVDAGTFVCDSGDGSPIMCDGRTQACKIVEGGAYPGVHAPACVSLPPGCQAAPTCACVASGLGIPSQSPCVDSGGDITVTEQVP